MLSTQKMLRKQCGKFGCDFLVRITKKTEEIDFV